MRYRKTIVLALLLIVGHSICSAALVRRFAIVAGANRGGPGRSTLRYAVSDAQAFATLVQELGGVRAEDCTLLADPSVDQFAQAFLALRNSIRTGREIGGRVEVIFYYSGHADEQGLMLGVGRFPYERIRDEIGLLKADVNLAILDACASGAITRLKGGVRYPAFLANSAANMRGYAFLTSSSDNETAQESDRIQASFFTYYLISALRGAADSSGDGRVSLNEAYEFSYNETLGRTAKTQGGPQHPAYDIQMAGTGELIITDVRGVSSILVLPEDLSGRLYVMNSQKQLVAELFKPAGRKTELGLDAGTYHVYLQTDSLFLAASLKLKENETVTLERQLFIPAKKEPSILRGPSVYLAYESLLANKSRLEMSANPNGGDWGAAYSFGLREDFSLRLSAVRLRQDFDRTLPYDSPSSAVTYKVLFGARYYPFKDTGNRVRPFLWAGLGPAVLRTTYESHDSRNGDQSVTRSFFTSATMCLQPGGGLDFFLGRRFVATLQGGYSIMPAFQLPHQRRWEASVNFGVLLGKGNRSID